MYEFSMSFFMFFQNSMSLACMENDLSFFRFSMTRGNPDIILHVIHIVDYCYVSMFVHINIYKNAINLHNIVSVH